jgi:hypothetical protein
MSQTMRLTIHLPLPRQEEMELPYQTEVKIFVWSQNSIENSEDKLKEVESTMTNHFPCQITINISEELIQTLKSWPNMENATRDHIRIKAVVSHHPSEDFVASTYKYVVIRKIPFNDQDAIYIHSKEQRNIYVKFFPFFKIGTSEPTASLITLCRHRSIDIWLIIHVRRLQNHMKQEGIFDRRNRKK